MAEAIIRQAEDTLRRGDIGAAKAAQRSFKHKILSENRHDLIGDYERIYGNIGEPLGKAGILS